MKLHLISHKLCPYVQRVAIALAEKGMEFERIDVDLSNKPEWFLEISPLGKTPVLVADGTAIFESSVILEFLEEVGPKPMHPEAPLERARHRSWVEFASAVLNDIAGLYNADGRTAFDAKKTALGAKLQRIEDALCEGPYFAGERASLVDAAFAPVFRYFDTLERAAGLSMLDGLPRTAAWWATLSELASVRSAAPEDYPNRLEDFFIRRQSYLSAMIRKRSLAGV